MVEYQEYSKVLRLSRVELEQMHEVASIVLDGYVNKRSQSFLNGKLEPLFKRLTLGGAVATVLRLPVPTPIRFALAVVSLTTAFIGTDYYLEMLKQGERDLKKAMVWAQTHKASYKYFEIEVAFMEYMTTTPQGREPIVYVQGSDIIRRAQKHDGTWVNV